MVAERPLRADPALCGGLAQRNPTHDDIDNQRHVRRPHPARRGGLVNDMGQRGIGAGVERIGLCRLGPLLRRVGLADRGHRAGRADQPLTQVQQHVGRHVPLAVKRVVGEQLPHDPDHLGLEILH